MSCSSYLQPIIHDKWDLGQGSYCCTPDLLVRFRSNVAAHTRGTVACRRSHTVHTRETWAPYQNRTHISSFRIARLLLFYPVKITQPIVFSICSRVFLQCPSWRPSTTDWSVYSFSDRLQFYYSCSQSPVMYYTFYLAASLSGHPLSLTLSRGLFFFLFACSSRVFYCCTTLPIIFLLPLIILLFPSPPSLLFPSLFPHYVSHLSLSISVPSSELMSMVNTSSSSE